MTGAGIDVVGVTARGWPDLAERERELILTAQVVLGSERQLALIEFRPGQRHLTWPSPLRSGLPGLLAEVDGATVVALASGDPTLSGIGTTLSELLGSEAVRIHPAVSSVALARARLRWSAEESEVVSVVGRDLDRVRARLAPGVRLIVLSADANTPAALAAILVDAGFGDSELTVLGDLGTDAETERQGRARYWEGASPQLNLVGMRCRADDPGRSLGWAPGLPDEAYEHDGQLTKRDLRASALARLAPQPGQLLWDLGAGAGSVGIEWARTDPRCRAIAVERNPERAQRIGRNASRLGVPDLQVVSADHGDALDWLPAPDAIFVGGGADDDLLRRCWHLLGTGGRLVVHAVTLETEASVIKACGAFGGELVRIGIETVEPLGSFSGWRPSRSIVQWSCIHP